MGGRSEGESDVIAFIHATDAASWAVFLQNKLRSDSYRIQSYLHHDPNQNYIPELFSSRQTCAVLVSPFLLEPQYSVFWKQCASRFHQRTVFLFLGVNQEDLRSSNLGASVAECVLSCHWLEVDGSREVVSNALVKLIEVFESSDASGEAGDEQSNETDDVYVIPPNPRQKNQIVQVMPRVLYEDDSHEMLVVMEREAEGTLTMVAESDYGPSQHIVMDHVVSSVYLVKLPNDFVGKINLKILTEKEFIIGNASVYVHERLEQLCDLLRKETTPVAVMCKVMGLSGSRSSQMEELDSLLASRLAFSQLPPSLKNVLFSENQTTADQGTSQWPSLLHFAAEFNLTKVCEELLRYPGIVLAACTENCNGLFPCQLAEKNGYAALQYRLVQFVEDTRLRRSAADSGISVSENLPVPAPHSFQSHIYINERQPATDLPEPLNISEADYIDMSAKPFYGYAKPRSYSEGCVRTPYAKTPSEARIVEEDGKENEPPPLEPKIGRARSTASDYVAPSHLLSIDRHRDSSGSEDSDSQKVKPDESNHSKSSTETLTHSESGTTSRSEEKSDEKSEEKGERVSWNLGPGEPQDRPTSQASSISSQPDLDLAMGGMDTPLDDSQVVRIRTKRSKSVQDKITQFFKKIRPARRLQSSSESDLMTKGLKKTIVSTRQSTSSTSSDPSGYLSSTLRSTKEESERDSGAVCDVDGSSVTLRTKTRDSSMPRSTGKRNGISMQRRDSLRVQRAKNEDLSETPTLPARESSSTLRETFVSYMKSSD